jgi:hypothetical protein
MVTKIKINGHGQNVIVIGDGQLALLERNAHYAPCEILIERKGAAL